ncbi:MAG: sugar phosphate nucleotidyltransferase [Lentimicrobiaceae bacterium]|nr:sugar phosphate nucleotidyltransferase [Lentimicrobiaceae bacterium]
MKAMIFAAGLGTRLKHLTEDNPKALVAINGKPLLEWQIKHLQKFNIYDVVINVHHFADKIIDFLSENNNFGSNITISNESKQLLDTGGGLLFASRYFDDCDLILVQNVDIICDINYHDFIEYHNSTNNLVTLAVGDRNTNRKFMVDENNYLAGWTNQITDEKIFITDKLNNSRLLAFSGIQIIDKKFISMINLKGKFSIIDAYLQPFFYKKIGIYEHNIENWLDVGKPENIETADKLINKIYK